ncbi:hypothetical protein KUTeg_001348 [Tegillarca granosa]|uniref:PB1 domain-containing protein n=1 Tax=Tegillarca granosa TaxID=220873 RepID=A0ABQ9FR74_TEGGR|nr:hypothetical protein KUTeg_001348 [Tegillarca granosa]
MYLLYKELSDVMGSIQSQLAAGLRVGDRKAQQAAYANLHLGYHIDLFNVWGYLLIKLLKSRSIHLNRPVTYDLVREKIREMYSLELNIFFTQANGEMRIPIQCQKDLDTAINLVDKNDQISSLRLFLTLPAGSRGPPSIADSAYGSQTCRDSPSPPPGSLPHNYKHSVSCGSVHSEGEFIPEQDDMDLFMFFVIDSPAVYLINKFSGDTYPLRGRSSSRRSILSDSLSEQGDSKVRFGTFPRGFDSSTQHNDVGGHGTFPRTNHMNRRPDLGTNTLRSIMSRGSEGTLSTSSSSSGLPPDPDMDSPEGRILYKRNSDIDSPVFNFPDYPFSKCE